MNSNHGWCEFCGASAFEPSFRAFRRAADELQLGAVGEPGPRGEQELRRCARCGEPELQLATRSTLRPVAAADWPSRRHGPRHHRAGARSTRSVAFELFPNCWHSSPPLGTTAPVVYSDTRAWRSAWLDDNGQGYTSRHDWVDLAPVPGRPEDRDLWVRLLVEEAREPAGLVVGVEQLFAQLVGALRAGDEFRPTEVYDAGTDLFGCCVGVDEEGGCGAWPLDRHWQGENPACPEGEFLGWWDRFAGEDAANHHRNRRLLEATKRAVSAMAALFDGTAGAPRRRRRLALAHRDWLAALAALPAPEPAPQVELWARPEPPDAVGPLVARVLAAPYAWMRRADPGVVFGAEPFESAARAGKLRRSRRAA